MTAIDFLSREVLFLAILAALGSGPASFLSSRFSTLGRAAMAPAFGMCIGTALSTCLVWFFPADRTYWLIPIFTVLSLAIAIYRSRARWGFDRTRSSPRVLSGLLQILLVVVVVSAPTAYTFAQAGSVGPVTYLAPDSGAYVLVTDGMIHESLSSAAADYRGPWPDLVQTYYSQYASGFQEIDIDPFAANVDALVGIGATGTQSPFMLADLVSGALGAFAAVLYFLRRRSWAPVLAGALFGGAFFLHLFFDGSEGAICGLAVLLPLVVVGIDAISNTTLANAILVALLCSGLMALYPLFVAPAALVAMIVLVALAAKRVRTSTFAVSWLRRGLGYCLGVALMAAAMDPVVFLRDLRYWRSANGMSGLTLPRYDLPISVLPGWLLQSRGFYGLSFTGHSLLSNIAFGAVLPVLAGFLIFIVIRQYPVVWIPVVLICISGLLALYEYVHTQAVGYSCSYCEDRSLLPIAVALVLLVALGSAVLAASPSLVLRLVGVAAVLFFLLASAIAVENQRVMFQQASQFLPSSVGTVLEHLPTGSSIVELEGFDEALPNPVASLMFAYARADEAHWNHVSIPADYNENTSLMYFGGLGEQRPGLPNSEFHPDYSYVLTRIAGVATSRKVLFRDGPVALEMRATPLDVLVDYGFTVADPVADPLGVPFEDVWANEPIQVIVTGAASRKTYVGLWFRLPTSARVRVTAAHLVSAHQRAQSLEVCVETSGLAESRTADVTFPPATEERLVATAVSSRGCPSDPVAGR